MSIAEQPPAVVPPELAAVPSDLIMRLRVDQYHDMIRTGVLTEDSPVELLDGWLVFKMPKNPPHRIATRKGRVALEKILPAGWYVDTQEPITTEDSEPEPDVSVVRGDTEQYPDHNPGPQDVGLLVEVADTTLQRDRTTKKQLYARARIPVYWIINLVDNQVEVHTDPSGPGASPDYRRRQDYGPDDAVPLVLDGREVGRVPVRDLLP
jgi:Uma2 family endonuclease